MRLSLRQTVGTNTAHLTFFILCILLEKMCSFLSNADKSVITNEAPIFVCITSSTSKPLNSSLLSPWSSFSSFSSPFHMRMATPLAKSSSVTRPKSSVTPASVLQGDRQMDSPWRRESGRPNLSGRGFKRKNDEGSWTCFRGQSGLCVEISWLVPDGQGRSRLHLRLLFLNFLFILMLVPTQPSTGRK